MFTELSRRKFLASCAVSAISPALSHAQPGIAGALALFDAVDDAQPAANAAGSPPGVIDLSRSPYAKLKTIPVSAVIIEDGFWSRRRTTNLEASIPSMHDELIAHGRMTNFQRLEGKSAAKQIGPVYSDSDIYKWTEAVGFVLQSSEQAELKKTADAMIRDIVAAQEPGGYLNTYYVGDKKPERMLYPTQTTGHELYCIGHLLQAAIAYYRATGDRTLLDAGARFVDQFLLPDYGPGPEQKGIVAGHPEIEMALVELYRTTGKRAYLELAGYILHGDPRIPLTPRQTNYMFCGVPFTSRTHLEGHAVRAMYACCGATDYYLETGDQAYWKTLHTLWQDLAEHQLYVTGGVGAREAGEAFGDAYELPNARAYGESCAAIGNMMWNWRMLAGSGDARFADVIERALYNGINSGMSLDGTTYCYRNPLAYDSSADASESAGTPTPGSTGNEIRNPWYDTTCCPPNLERTFASLPGYFYSTDDDGVYVHLYDNSKVRWHLKDGTALEIRQTTNYPWSGDVKIAVDPVAPGEFTMRVRIPGWSEESSVKVNGELVDGARAGEYLAIRRRWSANDSIELSFDMRTRLLKANPAVSEDLGRVAFQRGPIVYCMEHLDQAGREQEMNLAGYAVQLDAKTVSRFDASLLDGVMVLEHPGTVSRSPADESLYFQASEDGNAEEKPATVRLIPYYAWANRGPSAMQVWIPYTRA